MQETQDRAPEAKAGTCDEDSAAAWRRARVDCEASAIVRRRLSRIFSLDDFERAARRRMPRTHFGFVAGGTQTETTLAANRQAWSEIPLLPRIAVDTHERTVATSLFGHEYAAPIGIAPVGSAVMSAFRGDLVLARAAREANIPFVLSGASTVPLERIVQEYPRSWFQAYLPGDENFIRAMLARVAAAGFRTLVVTLDTPVLGNRENNRRNRYSIPPKINPHVIFDWALHPGWFFGTLLQTLWRDGMPHAENFEPERGPGLFSRGETHRTDRDRMDWDLIARVRDLWKGRLVLKGILAPEDAARAASVGADGIIVSNHGGRQLDTSVATALILPDIRSEAGAMTVIVDGGIRRGSDILKARALGADFCLAGRPFLYSANVGGVAGILHAVEILRDELDRDMALLGITSTAMPGDRLHMRSPAG